MTNIEALKEAQELAIKAAFIAGFCRASIYGEFDQNLAERRYREWKHEIDLELLVFEAHATR